MQVGGMSDPFSVSEEGSKSFLEILRVLRRFNYPYVISTKDPKIASSEYLSEIVGANSYVRLSLTVIADSVRHLVDRGCKGKDLVLDAVAKLSNVRVPVCVRFQPIIPGFEACVAEMMTDAHQAGANHVSAEFLKVPIDANRRFGAALSRLLGGEPVGAYRSKGAIKQGREYVLPREYRYPHLLEAYAVAKNLGMTFGFADNDLLLHSDGNSCCSAADLYLDANFFDANVVALAKSKQAGASMELAELIKRWTPSRPISTYLNSKSRITQSDPTQPDWHRYLEQMWSGSYGIYCPDFFDGIESAGRADTSGNPVFLRVASEFEVSLNEARVQAMAPRGD